MLRLIVNVKYVGIVVRQIGWKFHIQMEHFGTYVKYDFLCHSNE